ncbi:MAG: multidrug efflux system membrane fusion protein [Alcanivorax sp.]|jgi:multidrug efflux system membrane fusion protein
MRPREYILGAKSSSIRSLLMRKNLIIASLIFTALFLWLVSGLVFNEAEGEPAAAISEQQLLAKPKVEQQRATVRAAISKAEKRARLLVLRGRTESKRSVDVKAEIAGNVVERAVERGSRVESGDVLCQLAIDDRDASVAEARAALKDAQIDYQGILKLQQQGLQSETAIARAGAQLESAKAQLRRQDLNLARTRIVAPFSGVVENLHMNKGDYATPGAICATLIDLDPMLVSADVTEAEVENIEVGNFVSGTTSNGAAIVGTLTFIGMQSDPLTRTYPVEITVENSDYSLRSGLTTTARIKLDEVFAHKVSPALFTLNDAGDFGVRTIGDNNVVDFYKVEIIEDTVEGVWIIGLPDTVKLITVGQEFVLAGQAIDPVYPADSVNEASQ